MDPISLTTLAISMATPFLNKTGEKIVEGVGEDIWKWIKSAFCENKKDAPTALTNNEDLAQVRALLLRKIENDSEFKDHLEHLVKKGQQTLNYCNQQIVNNNGEVQKQINITNNSGNIQL